MTPMQLNIASVRARDEALDDAWEITNALGGSPNPGDVEDVAYNSAISDVLRAIEGLGGMDPLVRRDRRDQRTNAVIARFAVAAE